MKSAEDQRDRQRPFEEHEQDQDEDHRGAGAADGGAFPGRRQVAFFRGGAACRWSGRALSASSRVRGRARRPVVSMRPPWVPRCLRRRLFLRLGHGVNLMSGRGAAERAARSRAAPGRSRGSARRPGSRRAPPPGSARPAPPRPGARRAAPPAGAPSSTTVPSVVVSGSWTLVETWARPLDSIRPIARTPGSPPPPRAARRRRRGRRRGRRPRARR